MTKYSSHEICNKLPTLSKQEVNNQLSSIPGWSYNKITNSIERSFEFKGFYQTMAFINAVAWIAHEHKHHPDVIFGYNHVKISYQTHSSKGVTDVDIICAKEINDLL